MNTTKNTALSGVFGSFARSGFFVKRRARATKPVQGVSRKPGDAATPAQAARLLEVLVRG